jgi:hypothetical protein
METMLVGNKLVIPDAWFNPARITSGRIEDTLLDLLCGAARKSRMRLQPSMAGSSRPPFAEQH